MLKLAEKSGFEKVLTKIYAEKELPHKSPIEKKHIKAPSNNIYCTLWKMGKERDLRVCFTTKCRLS